MTEEATTAAEAKPIDVYEFLTAVLNEVAAVSWQKLGLQPDILTGKLHQDLVQARVAIETVAHISTAVEPQLDEEDRRRLQGLVRDLRINWLERNKEVEP